MQTHTRTVPRTAYTLDETAQSLGLSRRTLYGLMESGKLSTVKLGKRRLVPAQELTRLVTPTEATA